jgi:Fe-S cluster assembly protein SufD
MKLAEQQCLEQLLLDKPFAAAGWLGEMRHAARTQAEALGFPTTRHDDWRFTDLAPLFQHRFAQAAMSDTLGLADLQPYFIPDAVRLVFVDGHYHEGLSDITQAGSSVTIQPLAACLTDGKVEALLNRQLGKQRDFFSALNTYLFADGAWINIRGECQAPIHLLHVATQRDAPAAMYPRYLVAVESGSRAVLVQDYVAMAEVPYLCNAATEIALHEHAALQHVVVQRDSEQAYHIGHCAVRLAANSSYTSTSLALGARLSRQNMHVVQQGAGAEIHVHGLAVVNGRQVADTHTLIEHAVPHGKSMQLHKCIAGGAAQAVFGGKIVVQEGAVATDAVQESRNLLLSAKARIDTQPQLEILNDDVRCKHGATVGQLDPDALFFLASRGFSAAQARSLLVQAFAGEIVERIPAPSLVTALNKAIAGRLTK